MAADYDYQQNQTQTQNRQAATEHKINAVKHFREYSREHIYQSDYLIAIKFNRRQRLF